MGLTLNPKTGELGWSSGGSGGGLSAVVDDTDPHLGGDLDTNSFKLKLSNFVTMYGAPSIDAGGIYYDAGLRTMSYYARSMGFYGGVEPDGSGSYYPYFELSADGRAYVEAYPASPSSGTADFLIKAPTAGFYNHNNNKRVLLSVDDAATNNSEVKWPLSSGTIALLSDISAGSGDVVGPSSATDNAIARFDTTTGKLIQDSSATISDNGAMVITAATNTDIPLIVKGADYFGVPIQQWYNSYLGTPSLYGEFDANGNFRVRPGGNDVRSVLLGDPPGAGFPGVWIGSAAASPNYGNYSFLSDGTGGVLFNATGGQLARFRNGNYARMTVGQHGINVGGVDTGTISDEPSSAQVFKIEPGIFSATTKTVLVLQGLASQSGNLLECQDNTGAVLAKISAGGDVEVTDTTKGVILKAPNGSRWRITVDNSGTLITTSI